MDIYEAIKARASVRSFKAKDVAPDMISRLLEAARLAPSASNRQEWRFIVVRDPGKRKELAAAALGQQFVGDAPVVLVCCAETDNHEMACGQLCYPIDVAIAIDHITLCAVAEGLGTCWMSGVLTREKELLKFLGLEDRHLLAVTPVGYSAKTPPVVPRKDRPVRWLGF